MQVAADHEVVDPDQQHGTLRVDDGPFVVGVSRPAGETAAVGELAEAIGEPAGDPAQVLIREQPAVGGGGHQVSLPLGRAKRGLPACGSHRRQRIFASVLLPDAAPPFITRIG